MSPFHGLLGQHVIIFSLLLASNLMQVSGIAIRWSSYYDAGRFLTDEANSSISTEDLGGTIRADPLRKLHKYKGGYDLTNEHYWSSIIFTSVYGLSIAVLWSVCGCGFGLVFALLCTCCKKRRRGKKSSRLINSRCCSPLHFLASVLTLLSIIAGVLILAGNHMFHSTVEDVVDVVEGTATEAVEKIYTITGAYKHINPTLLEIGDISKANEFLNSTAHELDSRAVDVRATASNIREMIDEGLQIMYTVVAATTSLTLVFVIALLAFGILKYQKTVYLLIVICWIFAVILWSFFGVFFFIRNLVGDTCIALRAFNLNPYKNSLNSILPCDKLLSAGSVLTNVGRGIHDSIDKVNQNISASYGIMLQICNPFSAGPTYVYQPWNNSPTCTRIGDIPRVMRMLMCPDDEVKVCEGGIMINGNYFRMVEAYSSSIQKLLDVFPDMESLVRCGIIEDAFSIIVNHQCKPMKRWLQLMWVSLLLLSVLLVVLLFVWVIAAVLHCRRAFRSSTSSSDEAEVDAH